MYKSTDRVENTAYSTSLLPFLSSYALYSRAENSNISRASSETHPLLFEPPIARLILIHLT
jgi:hypothetical protein